MAVLHCGVIRDKILDGVKKTVEALPEAPSLTVIQVGDNQASTTYVRNKKKACDKVGIISEIIKLPCDITETALLQIIDNLNRDSMTNGILVQLPLPSHINEQTIIEAINPLKDVDGFHPINAGKLLQGSKYCLRPCTPSGVMEIIKYTGLDIVGKHAVVVGRSNIVGKPMAQMLINEGATVTVCNSKTENLAEVTKSADILVVAVGKEGTISGDMIKDGALVIDVGINRNSDGKLCGDVKAGEISGATVTPVPGGVGLMTVAMLMANTVMAYHLQNE